MDLRIQFIIVNVTALQILVDSFFSPFFCCFPLLVALRITSLLHLLTHRNERYWFSHLTVGKKASKHIYKCFTIPLTYYTLCDYISNCDDQSSYSGIAASCCRSLWCTSYTVLQFSRIINVKNGWDESSNHSNIGGTTKKFRNDLQW